VAVNHPVGGSRPLSHVLCYTAPVHLGNCSCIALPPYVLYVARTSSASGSQLFSAIFRQLDGLTLGLAQGAVARVPAHGVSAFGFLHHQLAGLRVSEQLFDPATLPHFVSDPLHRLGHVVTIGVPG
jgi:hypothetical protein